MVCLISADFVFTGREEGRGTGLSVKYVRPRGDINVPSKVTEDTGPLEPELWKLKGFDYCDSCFSKICFIELIELIDPFIQGIEQLRRRKA